ncbi:hypothetical protein EV141_2050 [Microcella putealis]|uniref:Uncharacterized protein n=2 Tax=Microcella putealis TaxID=337005 RepID=A0A4Q7LM78_9MICO|nr:hypothetical protein EV141_2050 [Microcella putealis]TQM19603.1 hypothetical protein BJ957_2428 [Microcella putealis]
MGWGAWAGIAALVVVNIVLVALLIGRPEPEVDEIASPGLISEPIPTPTPSETPSASPTPEPEPTPPATAPGQYVLAAVDGATASRVTTGACPTATATLERTVDGGATWQPSDATAATGITAVQRLIASSAEQLALIGSQADGCAPTLARTFVGGELDAAWYVPADDRASVHAPAVGTVAAPCGAVTAITAASNTVAAVLCADGTVHATADRASTFTGGVAIAGAQAVAAAGDGWAVAALGVDDCAGVAIAQVGADATGFEFVGCLPLDAETDGLAGRVALAAGGGTLWVWAGEQLARSESNGASWL